MTEYFDTTTKVKKTNVPREISVEESEGLRELTFFAGVAPRRRHPGVRNVCSEQVLENNDFSFSNDTVIRLHSGNLSLCRLNVQTKLKRSRSTSQFIY